MLDTRAASNTITSHNGTTYDARPISSPQDLLDLVAANHYDVIAIDEVQFFSNEIIPVIRTLIAQGKRVIIAGLDLDYRNRLDQWAQSLHSPIRSPNFKQFVRFAERTPTAHSALSMENQRATATRSL